MKRHNCVFVMCFFFFFLINEKNALFYLRREKKKEKNMKKGRNGGPIREKERGKKKQFSLVNGSQNFSTYLQKDRLAKLLEN